jgi:hypothetical protein
MAEQVRQSHRKDWIPDIGSPLITWVICSVLREDTTAK